MRALWNKVPRQDRVCQLCGSGSLCDGKHVVFQCLALQELREQYAPLFVGMSTMRQLFWQDDLVSVAKFAHACLDQQCTWLVQRQPSI